MGKRLLILAVLLVGLLMLSACQESNEMEEELAEAPESAGQMALDDEDAGIEPMDETANDEDNPAEEDIPDDVDAIDVPADDQDAEATAVETEMSAGMDPEEVRFSAEGDMPVAAWYYPPLGEGPAPGVLLLHQMNADRSAWSPLIERLRTERPDVAVMAMDFPGHGDSGGDFSDEAALAAAEAALEEFRGYEVVADGQIIMIGASIGADAAVDACSTGCAGAVSISPGGWLGIDYNEALSLISVPVLCLAAQNDGSTAQTCENGAGVGLADYEVHIYDGSEHGNTLAADDSATPEPAPTELIMQWLSAHLPETA